MTKSRLAAWAAALLLLLSLGLPWVSSRQEYIQGGGPSCVADLSGTGPMICNYISIGGGYQGAPGLSGSHVSARVFLVLALILVLYAAAARRRGPLTVAVVAAFAAVALGLPFVLSGQVAALVAALVILLARRGAAEQPQHAP